MPETSENYHALKGLVVRLREEILKGNTTLTPCPGNEQSLHTGPWRGLSDVIVRYDCVSFWLDREKYVEARVSLCPQDIVDDIRHIWLAIGPHFVDVQEIRNKVRDSS